LKGKKDMSSHLSPGRPVSVIPIEIDTDLSSVQHKRSSSAIPSLSNSLWASSWSIGNFLHL